MEIFTPIPDDPFSLSELVNFDNYAELCNPLAIEEQISSQYDSVPDNWVSSSSTPKSEQISSYSVSDNWGSSSSTPKSGFQFGLSSSSGYNDSGDVVTIPKPLRGVSLPEKMMRALSLFKETSGAGILAQVWMPIMHSGDYVLSTSEQPFLLDQILSGYREISRAFTFSPKEAPKEARGLFQGLPGRVFITRMPEWTSNIAYYSNLEYLRVDYAVRHEVRGSLAVPVFNPRENSCCAVLELVTMKENLDFDMEMNKLGNALQAVELKTINTRANQQTLTTNQKFALAEILDVLRAICHAHMLPLAVTWIPVCHVDGSMTKKTRLCIQESACYVNDIRMQGFLRACHEHILEKGQGVAGKALQSNQPFFYADVKRFDIREYPLAHHARKFGLQAAVAIRLRSTYTSDDDYILELFLPLNCRGSTEQQLLLDNLSSTMMRISRSLRTVSDTEIPDSAAKSSIQNGGPISPFTDIPVNHYQRRDSGSKLTSEVSLENQNMQSDGRGGSLHNEQLKSGSQRRLEKKRSSAEKSISLNVLKQYFSGSLKDAAKSIGVCPTTLKRICRQHGISRWPSRKINKVNRSLEKIQTVINSVQGVEGALKYDPATGCLVAAVTSSEKPTMVSLESAGRVVNPQPSASHLSPSEKITSRSSISMASADEMNAKIEFSSDSSSSSSLSCPTFEKKLVARGPGITVKATYKEDTIRFKFLPSMSCHQLFEEIGTRFNLPTETFQLKYMDDEEEWVMLVNDLDLQECIEVLGTVGSSIMKLLVRDVHCTIGSCSSSN